MAQRNKIEIEINAKDNASGVLSGIGGSLTSLGKVAAAGIGVLVGAAAAGGYALLDMAKSAAQLQGVEEAFQGIVRGMGGSVDQMLDAMRRGAVGMASDRDLMLSFNKAASLVSEDFASKLPDAMKMLAKVSSATGQDMGFLIDSLVTGVGRLSPMILDNLSIQVDVTAAQEAYAASIGKTVEELTKEEKQTALMAQVMEKLAENTASLPDVAGQADTMMAQLGAQFQNLKDKIGMRLIPAFTDLLKVAQGFLAVITLLTTGDMVSGIGDFIRMITGETGTVYEDHPLIVLLRSFRRALPALMAGVPLFDLLVAIFAKAEWQAGSYGMWDLAAALQRVQIFITDVLKPIADWVNQNIQLQDILLAVGTALGFVVIPFLISLAATVAPIILLFAGLVLAFSAIRQGWENDTLGIRTFIEGTLIPVVQAFAEMFKTGDFSTLPATLQTLFDGIAKLFWENLAAPIGAAIAWIKDTFIDPAILTAQMLFALGLAIVVQAAETVRMALESLALFLLGGLNTASIAAIMILNLLSAAFTYVKDKVAELIGKGIEWLQHNAGLLLSLSGLLLLLIQMGVQTKIVSAAMVIWRGVVTVFNVVWGFFAGLVTTANAGLAATNGLVAGLGAKMMFVIGPILAVGAAIAGVILQLQEFQRVAGGGAMAGGAAAGPAIAAAGISREQVEKALFEQFQKQFGDLGARLIFGSGSINVQGLIDQYMAAAATTGGTGMNAFANGGYTGDGSGIAGVVHPREYVVPENGALVMRGDSQPIQIIFQGSGGPRDQAEADKQGYMVVEALRRQGVNV